MDKYKDFPQWQGFVDMLLKKFYRGNPKFIADIKQDCYLAVCEALYANQKLTKKYVYKRVLGICHDFLFNEIRHTDPFYLKKAAKKYYSGKRKQQLLDIANFFEASCQKEEI